MQLPVVLRSWSNIANDIVNEKIGTIHKEDFGNFVLSVVLVDCCCCVPYGMYV